MKMPSHARIRRQVLVVVGLGGALTVVSLAGAQGWHVTSAPSLPWQSIASSADGRELVAVTGYLDAVYGIGTPLPIYISSDGGASWTPSAGPAGIWEGSYTGGLIYVWPYVGPWQLTPVPMTNDWASVACSSDGTVLAAASLYGSIWVSANTGSTWARTAAPNRGWISVACARNGTELVAAHWDGFIYSSPDGGTAWTQTGAPSNYWWTIASSADGSILVALGQEEDGYTSRPVSTWKGSF